MFNRHVASHSYLRYTCVMYINTILNDPVVGMKMSNKTNFTIKFNSIMCANVVMFYVEVYT